MPTVVNSPSLVTALTALHNGPGLSLVTLEKDHAGLVADLNVGDVVDTYHFLVSALMDVVRMPPGNIHGVVLAYTMGVSTAKPTRSAKERFDHLIDGGAVGQISFAHLRRLEAEAIATWEVLLHRQLRLAADATTGAPTVPRHEGERLPSSGIPPDGGHHDTPADRDHHPTDTDWIRPWNTSTDHIEATRWPVLASPN